MSDKFIGMYVAFENPIGEGYARDIKKYVSSFKGVSGVRLTAHEFDQQMAWTFNEKNHLVGVIEKELFKIDD